MVIKFQDNDGAAKIKRMRAGIVQFLVFPICRVQGLAFSILLSTIKGSDSGFGVW